MHSFGLAPIKEEGSCIIVDKYKQERLERMGGYAIIIEHLLLKNNINKTKTVLGIKRSELRKIFKGDFRKTTEYELINYIKILKAFK